MASNLSCGIFPLSTRNCAGVGECVYSPEFNRGVCVCPPDTTGLSDWAITSDLTDCFINNTVIRVLWAINVFACLVSIPPSFQRVRRIFTIQRSRCEARGVKFSVWSMKSLVAISPQAVIGIPAQIALGVMKIVVPTVHIGVNWGPTVCWWLLRFSFLTSMFSFQSSHLATLLRTQKHFNAEGIIARNYAISFGLYCFGLSTQFVTALPLAAYVDPFNPYLGIIAAEFFYLGSFIVLLSAGVQASYITRKVNVLLRDATDSRSLLIRSNLITLQANFGGAFYVQSFINFLFGVIPMLFHAHDYQLPITSITFAYLLWRNSKTLLSITEGPIGQDVANQNGGKTPAPSVEQRGAVAPAQQQRPPDQPAGKYQRQYETAFESKDVTSVVVVDENSDNLLARGEAWKRRAAAEHDSDDRIDE